MLSTSETLKQDIEKLTEEQLQKVAEFITFLRFQEKRRRIDLYPTQGSEQAGIRPVIIQQQLPFLLQLTCVVFLYQFA